MDVWLISMIIGIVITGIAAMAGGYFAGIAGALILGTIALLGLSFIPATPIIPIWIGILVIVIESILIAYKIAQGLGLGKGVIQ